MLSNGPPTKKKSTKTERPSKIEKPPKVEKPPRSAKTKTTKSTPAAVPQQVVIFLNFHLFFFCFLFFCFLFIYFIIIFIYSYIVIRPLTIKIDLHQWETCLFWRSVAKPYRCWDSAACSAARSTNSSCFMVIRPSSLSPSLPLPLASSYIFCLYIC